MEELYHHSPISAHCVDVLANPPKCYDFRGVRSYVLCRAWDLLEKEKLPTLPVSRAWQEARKVCVREHSSNPNSRLEAVIKGQVSYGVK